VTATRRARIASQARRGTRRRRPSVRGGHCGVRGLGRGGRRIVLVGPVEGPRVRGGEGGLGGDRRGRGAGRDGLRGLHRRRFPGRRRGRFLGYRQERFPGLDRGGFLDLVRARFLDLVRARFLGLDGCGALERRRGGCGRRGGGDAARGDVGRFQQQPPGGLVVGAGGRVLDEERVEHPLQGPGPPGRPGAVVDDGGNGGRGVGTVERRCPLDCEVQGGAQRPEVGVGACAGRTGLLGGEVRRVGDPARTGHLRIVDDRRHAEVHQPGSARRGEEHVGRTHVAVEQVYAMGGGEGVEQLEADDPGLRGGQRAVAGHPLGQRGSGHQLGDHERPALLRHHVEDGDGAGMVESGGGPCLAEDLLGQGRLLGVVEHVGELDLTHRHLAVGPAVVSPPHHTDRSGADGGHQLVPVGHDAAGTGLAGHGIDASHCGGRDLGRDGGVRPARMCAGCFGRPPRMVQDG
jgi:hypothetical protein